VLEAAWKNGPTQERDLWQGLAQLCVGLTHARRANPVGARALLQRGADRLHTYDLTGAPTYGVDLPDLIAWATHAAAVEDDADLPTTGLHIHVR